MWSSPASTSTTRPPHTEPLTPAKRAATDCPLELELSAKSQRLDIRGDYDGDVVMSDSDDEELDTQPRLSWRDKGKAKVRPVPELPEEVWKRVFELYYDQCADDWGTSGQIKGGLLPLLISPTHARVATPVLYSHPHISTHAIGSFMKCVKYPTRYSDAPTKIPLVKHLTVRPTPIMPAYEQIIVEQGKPEVVNPLFPSLTSMFPNVHSFTLKDTLVLGHEDAKCIFTALAKLAPKKARIELRMWDLYDSAICQSLIAATRPNVHALPQATGGTVPMWAFGHVSTQEAWRNAIITGRDLHLTQEWLNPRQLNNDNQGNTNQAQNPLPQTTALRSVPPLPSHSRPIPLPPPPAGGSATGSATTQTSTATPIRSSRIAAFFRPQASQDTQENVSQATILDGTGPDSDIDPNDGDNDNEAAEAWGLGEDGDESDGSEGLARAMMAEDGMPDAQIDLRIQLSDTRAESQRAQERVISLRQAMEDARYDFLVRHPTGYRTGPNGDDVEYQRLRADWQAAEVTRRAAETRAGVLRARLAAQIANDARSGPTSASTSTAPSTSIPGTGPARQAQPPVTSTQAPVNAILDASADTPMPVGASTTSSVEANGAAVPEDQGVPVQSENQMTVHLSDPTSTSASNADDDTPASNAPSSNIAANTASEVTPAQPAHLADTITATDAAASPVTSAQAVSTTNASSSSTNIARVTAVRAQPSASTASPSAPLNLSAIVNSGLTYAQRRKIDHIYFPPPDEGGPPAAGPSGTGTASDLSHTADPDHVPYPHSIPVNDSSDSHPVRLTAWARQARGTSSYLAHQMREMLLDLIQNHWTHSLKAFSFVAFDPLASLVVRAPKLDFWEHVPIEHIRVHLPRGVNSLAIFKDAKQNEKDHIRARRAAEAEAEAQADPGGDEVDDALAELTNLANDIVPDEEDDKVVGGDGMGGGLVHPSNRLFEIEVNTVRDMMDDMWVQAGSQLPPQVCRILLGEQDWSEVIAGRRRYPTSEVNEPDDFPSPRTADYASPTYSFSSSEEEDDGDVDEYKLDEEEGGCYDAEAAKRQAERMAARQKLKQENSHA